MSSSHLTNLEAMRDQPPSAAPPLEYFPGPGSRGHLLKKCREAYQVSHFIGFEGSTTALAQSRFPVIPSQAHSAVPISSLSIELGTKTKSCEVQVGLG